MSKTIENLETAFTGESMARSRYMFFARIARKEGFHYIAKIFEETAENEMYHALEEYRLLYGEKTTADNLKEAIKGESYEAEHMYPEFAVQAEIDQMIALMQEKIQPGDSYSLAYEPSIGTRVMRNDEELSIVPGLDFKQALFGIWLSDKPAQASLKKAMLAN